MRDQVFRIVIILIISIILPAIIFSVYEFSTLQKNEEMIQAIYNHQLETILNSVNQYADDITRSWSEVMNRFYFSKDNQKEMMNTFLSLNYQVKKIFFTDDTTYAKLFIYPESLEKSDSFSYDSLLRIIANNNEKIDQLNTFIQQGYRKIEPIAYNGSGKYTLFLFVLNKTGKQGTLCGIIVDAEQFIRDILGPRIQATTQEQFVITALADSSKNEIYSSDIYSSREKTELKKSLWLLPGYSLGIHMKEQTIQDLVRKRTRINLALLAGIVIILIIGAWLLYTNIRKEIQLAQIKSDFVSNVSHEIRTPLALINMFVETLEMQRVKSKEKEQEYYRIINQETQRLSGIVNKILNFSKIESGKRIYRMGLTNLNTITEKVLNVYKYHLESEGFTYTYVPDTSVPDINADEEAITDALINLIDNAVKYSQDNKSIEVNTGKSQNYVFAEVKDSGIGISHKDQKMIFDKFYRVADGLRAYQSKGTGLGLSIVKHVMDAHNGTISLESKPGSGSSFRLNFPVKKT